MKITKAILPVAGLGTRVMPLTLHQPKSMIGIVDRPMIHYVVDELATAGIKTIILIIGPKQKEFRQYLDYLKKDLEWAKLNLKFHFVVQKEPSGNGHAILIAKKFIKLKEPFVAAFGDDIIPANQSVLKNMIKDFAESKKPLLLLEKTPKKLLYRYGVVKIAGKSGNHCRIADIIEKPVPGTEPSDLTIVGRYVLPYEIFKYIKKTEEQTPKNKEIYLTNAFKLYIKKNEALSGRIFKGLKFDGGSKMGILKAQAYFSYHHPIFKKEFRNYLKKLGGA